VRRTANFRSFRNFRTRIANQRGGAHESQAAMQGRCGISAFSDL
jgi:hypothetical protein